MNITPENVNHRMPALEENDVGEGRRGGAAAEEDVVAEQQLKWRQSDSSKLKQTQSGYSS